MIVLLDNGRVMAGQVGDVPRVEHAMDAVMMLTAVATRLGDRAGLVAFDREVRAVVAPATGPTQLGRVTEAMYELEPALAESDYRGAFTATLARFRRRAMLVVLTDLVEQAVGEFLAAGAAAHLRPATSWSSPPCRTPRWWRWAQAVAGRRRRGLPQGGRGRRARGAAPHRRPPPGPRRHRGRRRARPPGPPPGRRLPQGQGDRPVVTSGAGGPRAGSTGGMRCSSPQVGAGLPRRPVSPRAAAFRPWTTT